MKYDLGFESDIFDINDGYNCLICTWISKMRNFIFITIINLFIACGNTEPIETTQVESQADAKNKQGKKVFQKVEANKAPVSKVEAIKATPTISRL